MSPIRLDLEPGASATSVKVTNQGDEPKLLQVTVLRWTREGGADRLEASDTELPLVTPPLFRLDGNGSSQVVRIGFRGPPPASDIERAWRVIVEELPQPPGTAGAAQVAMRLRISLPLFVPPSEVRQELHWEAALRPEGKLQLVAFNNGTVSERLDQVTVELADEAAPKARFDGPIYIFPGERRVLDDQADHFQPGSIKLLTQGTAPPPTSDLVLRVQ